jgi:hypothetical protein
MTCAKVHRIPYRRIAPGVPQASLTKPQKMDPQRGYFGESTDDMMRFFPHKGEAGDTSEHKVTCAKEVTCAKV